LGRGNKSAEYQNNKILAIKKEVDFPEKGEEGLLASNWRWQACEIPDCQLFLDSRGDGHPPKNPWELRSRIMSRATKTKKKGKGSESVHYKCQYLGQ